MPVRLSRYSDSRIHGMYSKHSAQGSRIVLLTYERNGYSGIIRNIFFFQNRVNRTQPYILKYHLICKHYAWVSCGFTYRCEKYYKVSLTLVHSQVVFKRPWRPAWIKGVNQENSLFIITLTQGMELNRNLAHGKVLSSLTLFLSVTSFSISHVTFFLK